MPNQVVLISPECALTLGMAAFVGVPGATCARVLDRDTLQGIQSCFYPGCDLVEGLSVFATAFELRLHTRMDPLANRDWKEVLAQAKALSSTLPVASKELYSKIGALFAG